MNLEIQNIKVRELISGSETRVSDNDIIINIEELKNHLMSFDERIVDLEIKVIPYYNEDTRIIEISDVFQPRCKVGKGNNFPGWVDEIETAGEGVTRSLENVIVVVSHADGGFHYSRALDTGGYYATLSRLSDKNILFLDGEVENCDMIEKDKILKAAGMRAAVYLAELAESMEIDNVETYDLNLADNNNPNGVPRICYYFQIHAPHYDDHSVPQDILYGQTVIDMPPSIIHPNEIIDGGLVGVHNTAYHTYELQNHALIKELYKRHNNKEIIFAGVVIGVLSQKDEKRTFFAKHGVKLMKEQLNAEGVILTKYQGGAPHLDQALMSVECEDNGIATCPVITPFTSVGSLEGNLVYVDKKLDLMMANYTYLDTVTSTFVPKTVLGGPKDGSKWNYLEKLYGETHFLGKEIYTEECMNVGAFYIEGFSNSFGAANMKATNY